MEGIFIHIKSGAAKMKKAAVLRAAAVTLAALAFAGCSSAGYIKNQGGSGSASARKAEASLRAALSAQAKAPVEQFVCDDFDGDGQYEAFALAGGVASGAQAEDSYAGELWYVSAAGAKQLNESAWYIHAPKVFSFGKQKLVVFEESFATGTLDHVWGVQDGKSAEQFISRRGQDISVMGNEVTLYQNVIDSGTVDSAPAGRTVKPYWFYWDASTHCIREYGGIRVTEAQARKIQDIAYVLNDAAMAKYEIMKIWYRANGILNVDFATPENTFQYATFRISGDSATLVDMSQNGVALDTFAAFGDGIYAAALVPAAATYPKSLPAAMQ